MNTSHQDQLTQQRTTAGSADEWRPRMFLGTHLQSRPIRAAVEETERVYELERIGESEWTPWIAIVALTVLFAVIGLLMFGIVEAASHLLVIATSER